MDKLRVTTMLGMLLIAGGTQAQDERGSRGFDSLDTDADGVVSYEEFLVRSEGVFATMDSDEDGVISLQEFLDARQGPRRGGRRGDGPPADVDDERSAEREARRAEMEELMLAHATAQFEQIDANGDGSVTDVEFHEASFLNLDADNSGTITADELRRQRGPGGTRGPRGHGRRGGGPASVDEDAL